MSRQHAQPLICDARTFTSSSSSSLESGRVNDTLQADHGPHAGLKYARGVDPRRLGRHVRDPPVGAVIT
jgi:hypothetical protein